jgi:hypothetical protein
MSKKSSIYVEVDSPMIETQHAMFIIEKFLKKNNIKMNLSIAYDYSLNASGVYFPFVKGQEYRIFINPFKCKSEEEIINQDINNQNNEAFCPGSPCDLTSFGIILHEFCHILQYKVYPTIIKDYSKEFPVERFYLNSYSNNEIHDEIAEIMTLYITNPYLLKLISKNHFNFCKKYFKSPISCTEDRCSFIYSGWPIRVKEHLKKDWGITYNISTKKFVRIDNGKV